MILFWGIFLTTSYAQNNHGLFTEILEDHVKDGLVNYKGLCEDARLSGYLQKLSLTNPSVLSENDGMAFWINAYNAYTLELICEHYPVKSINDIHTGGLILGSAFGKTAWDKPFIIIHGQSYTLNHIEHKILRPQYKDVRIHFAIVCAAKSCPPLRNEAYEGHALDQQLNDQAQIFLTEKKDLNSFDLNQKTANLSSIFKWFMVDFGGNHVELLNYVSQFLPDDIALALKQSPSSWRIKFNKYDWSLNEQNTK